MKFTAIIRLPIPISAHPFSGALLYTSSKSENRVPMNSVGRENILSLELKRQREGGAGQAMAMAKAKAKAWAGGRVLVKTMQRIETKKCYSSLLAAQSLSSQHALFRYPLHFHFYFHFSVKSLNERTFIVIILI